MSERYHARDLTYSAEHRRALPAQYERIGHRADVCDRDWTEYCHFCKEPLGINEEVRDRGQDLADKATTVTRRLAARARLPAKLIAWRTGRPEEVQQEMDALHARLKELEAAWPITGITERRLYPVLGEFERITPTEHWRRIALLHAEHERQCTRVPHLERLRLVRTRARRILQSELFDSVSAYRGDRNA